MEIKQIEKLIEPHLHWEKKGVGLWEATTATSSYRLILLPKPIERWVANINGKRELKLDPDVAGETLTFWYAKDAKHHCHERENGRPGFIK